MSGASAFAAIVVVGLFTYASRGALILFLADRTLSPRALRSLRHVAPAVLTALVVTFAAGGEGIDGIEVVEAGALAAGTIATYFTRKLPVGLFAGMTTLWLLLALTPL